MWYINILSNVELLYLMPSLHNEMECTDISEGLNLFILFSAKLMHEQITAAIS